MNRIANKHQAYRKAGVHTADPGRVLLMLYDGCIRFCEQAKERIEAKDMEMKGKRINEAQAILFELTSSLNHSVSPDLCGRLEALYGWMVDALSTANRTLETHHIDDVVRLMSTLRAAWAQVVEGKADGSVQMPSLVPSPPSAGQP